MLTGIENLVQVQAARDTGALKEAKDKLEKRVEELTWRLDFEKHLRVCTFNLLCSKRKQHNSLKYSKWSSLEQHNEGSRKHHYCFSHPEYRT